MLASPNPISGFEAQLSVQVKGAPGMGKSLAGLDPLPGNQPRATGSKLNTAAEAKNARLWHLTQRRLSSCGSFDIDNRSRCQVRPLIVFAV